MLEDIFNINSFNIFSDSENYYFFRALNMADNYDLEHGITLDNDGKILKIRTDRERYDGEAKYFVNSQISLEEITEHIKMHQFKGTNCISLTSNANTAITYGRGNYKDKYVMIKVSKKEIGSKVFEAGFYMLQEVVKEIDKVLESDFDNKDIIKYYIDRIDNCTKQDQLDIIKNELDMNTSENDEDFIGGIRFKTTNSIDYLSLNSKQNFEKNKIVLKLNLLPKQILPKISNDLIIRTIGNAFSSLELIHYNEIE